MLGGIETRKVGTAKATRQSIPDWLQDTGFRSVHDVEISTSNVYSLSIQPNIKPLSKLVAVFQGRQIETVHAESIVTAMMTALVAISCVCPSGSAIVHATSAGSSVVVIALHHTTRFVGISRA